MEENKTTSSTQVERTQSKTEEVAENVARTSSVKLQKQASVGVAAEEVPEDLEKNVEGRVDSAVKIKSQSSVRESSKISLKSKKSTSNIALGEEAKKTSSVQLKKSKTSAVGFADEVRVASTSSLKKSDSNIEGPKRTSSLKVKSDASIEAPKRTSSLKVKKSSSSVKDESEPETPSLQLRGSRTNTGEEIEDEIPLYIFDISLTERKSRLAVKFTTKDKGIFAQAFLPNTDIDQIKTIVAWVLDVKPRRFKHELIQLTLMKQDELDEFKNDAHEALTCMMDTKTFMSRLVQKCKYEELIIPDYVCVSLKNELNNTMQCKVIELYNRAIKKPWVGGYRHISTDTEYHHAFSQTGPRAQVRPPELMSSRDTQTSWCRNRKLDMPYARATQSYKDNFYMPTISDVILTPRPYETAEEREKRLNVEMKVRTIQRYFRAWKMRLRLKELCAEYCKRKRLEMERERAEMLEDWRRRRRDLICQVFPRSRTDFSMLYAMAEEWKKKEMCKIDTYYCGPAKIAELALLSDKEIDVFRVIDKLQKEVQNDTRRQDRLNFLKKLGKPIRWYCQYKHIPIEMDTLENQAARKLDILYQKVIDRSLSEIKRMDALYELKLTLRNDDCEIAIELIHLVDRALSLLSRGFSKAKIECLQKRIDLAVAHHIKQRECFQEICSKDEGKAIKLLENNIFICARCEEMKTVNSFRFNARSQQVNICNKCKWLDKTIEPWCEMSPYRFILKQIRKAERLYNSPSSIAFILQDSDIYHLVTQIWHSHSAISESKDVYNLRLARWRCDRDWSPWNCILLTVPEAKAHVKVGKLSAVYHEEFIKNVFNKHELAKKHFADLTSIERRFKSMYRIPSSYGLDPNGYNDFRKMFNVDTTKREYF